MIYMLLKAKLETRFKGDQPHMLPFSEQVQHTNKIIKNKFLQF